MMLEIAGTSKLIGNPAKNIFRFDEDYVLFYVTYSH